uniref:Pleckstriny domain-containing family H member 1 n=1 Tax=Ascaris suum TaxID=6253 RepID=F1KT42_ASCSU
MMSAANSPSSETASDEVVVGEKTAKIKRWVRNRLLELEEQNERLRVQNLKCTAQLQVLKSCADRTKHWQNSLLFSHSVTGALPSTMMDRTSDDSGLTSDDTWERKTDLMTQSASALYKCASIKHAKKPGKPVRVRGNSLSHEGRDEENSSTTDSSPWEEKPKPIPTPRKTKANAIPPSHTVIERDSLNSYGDENDYREDDEIFDEIDYPQSPNERDVADYVNLNEMFLLGTHDDYGAVTKTAPALPMHRPPNQWETKLYQMAERCLSTVLSDDDVAQCSTVLNKAHLNDNTSDLCSSPSRRSDESSRSSNRRRSHDISVQKEGDYAVPPDATQDIRSTLINSGEPAEKSGYLIQMTDSRLKSLKRRYFVLKDSNLSLYRTQKNYMKGEEPLVRIAVSDIRSVTKISTKMGNGLQILTSNCRHCYTGESEKVTEEWLTVLNQNMRSVTISEVSQRATALNSLISGYVLKAKCGISKRFYASVIDSKLLFFKNAEDRIPCSHMFLKGAHICEKSKGSADEYSGSSDEQNDNKDVKDFDHTICIEIAGSDPVYIVLRSSEEKDKWLYFLKNAAGDAAMSGTPFEVLVQRMMSEPRSSEDDTLWNDVLLTVCEEKPRDTLTSIADESVKKKALELSRACYMFTSVLMRPSGVQYHIDLAQNILSTAMHSDALKNELYAQLIKLTSGSMPYGIQAWKLLALTAPLFTPRQYSLLWLLRQHIQRWITANSDEGNMARYCDRALSRCLKAGCRYEGPSKLEAISILTRDPTSTNMPHSIAVLLPTGDYHVVDFDGSTDIGDCLSALCVRCALRPALLSGYALYAEDALEQGRYVLLKGKQKLCDCLSRWERELMDSKSGRVTEESARIRLALRQRQYWTHLVSSETPAERLFLVHRMANEIVAGRIPMSNELAEELAAVYAQMHYGDIGDSITDEQLRTVTISYFPAKMLDVGCERTLRLNIQSHWTQLRGTSPADCVRMILVVLRKWRFFGAHITEARMKMRNDERIFIALNDQGVHLLTVRQLDVIRSFPYHRLVSFGGYHNDFMLTVDRILPPEAHPEETARERLTFSMPPRAIDQLTCHLAEYIRCQKLIWKLSTKKL